jgi:hypothetical protein
MGSEFIDYRTNSIFRNVSDVRQIVDKLKYWELESKQILRCKAQKEKYDFVPLETH